MSTLKGGIIRINWMEGCGNNPSIEIHGVTLPTPARIEEPVYERRRTIHRYDKGDFVHFFSSDGQPCRGFGGSTFAGTFTDGRGFEYQGAWSSRASAVNMLWTEPERLVVDVCVGHIATHVLAAPLIALWREQQPDFGLMWERERNGELHLRPTRNGKPKNPSYPNAITEHIAP